MFKSRRALDRGVCSRPSSSIFTQELEDARGGIVVNGRYINIGFADDTVLLVSNKMELQRHLDAVVTRSEIPGVTLNIYQNGGHGVPQKA